MKAARARPLGRRATPRSDLNRACLVSQPSWQAPLAAPKPSSEPTSPDPEERVRIAAEAAAVAAAAAVFKPKLPPSDGKRVTLQEAKVSIS